MSSIIVQRCATGASLRRSRCVARQAVADPPMTMTEAIIARRAGQPSVQPGDNVWVDVDKLMTHDVCGPGTFGVFEKEFGENAQVRHGMSQLGTASRNATLSQLPSNVLPAALLVLLQLCSGLCVFPYG